MQSASAKLASFWNNAVAGMRSLGGTVDDWVRSRVNPRQPSFGPRSLGAAEVPPTVLQTNGHVIKEATRRALGLDRETAKNAMEALKDDIGRSASDHSHKIWSNGDVTDRRTGELLGNLYDYAD
jgi:hypothetical protein